MKKEKTIKKEFTHLGEWEEIPASSRKLVMLILMYFNEAGNKRDGITLVLNRWVRKLYPLPRTNSQYYNSRKSVRSQYWKTVHSAIDKYIVEI